MVYIATRDGERAIEQFERLIRTELGSVDRARIDVIRQSMPYLIDRVMGEASLYAPDLAALPVAAPVAQHQLFTHRQILAVFKDIPGGQVLGPSLLCPSYSRDRSAERCTI